MKSDSLLRYGLSTRANDVMKDRWSRRAALRAIGGLPLMLATGAAALGNTEDFAAALTRDARLIGFASARAEELAGPMTTLSGRLPPDLTGILWRNGPAEHKRFGHRYGHWFDGDGMVQAFTFGGTGVSHRARILDTPKRRRETRAGKRIVPAFATLPPQPRPMLGPDDMNVANTSMLAHAGYLMALWEGGSALSVDPETLAAGRFIEWSPELTGVPFSAHPKVEPNGTLWNIGFAPLPWPALLFYRIDRTGHLVKTNIMPIAPLGMVHDFVVTARHLVVLLTPFVLEPDRFSTGRASFLDAHIWRPDLGTRVLAVEKDTLEVARRYELPPGFHFHHGNGWEEADSTIRLDLCQAPNPEFVTNDLRAVMRGEWRFSSTPPGYRHVVLKPNGAAKIDHVEPGAAEFPRIDLRRTGLRHRMVFALTGDGVEGDWPFQRVARLEPDSGMIDGWSYPRHQIPEEHVFVPRREAEGDGWLLGPFLDVRRRVTGLNIFEAMRLADGPVWQGILPYPLPLGLHGTFVKP